MQRFLSISVFGCFLGLVASSLASCAEDDPPTCTDAIANFYDAGCVLVVDEEQIGRPEALDGCREWVDNSEVCGCSEVSQQTLDCMAGIDFGECDACSGVFARLQNCLAASC